MSDCTTASSSSITKTAWDAIHAKHSALMAGYPMVVADDHDDDEHHPADNTSVVVYRDIMLRTTTATTTTTTCSSKNKLKRQTPLVNAGYASRVLAMSQAIRSYLVYHEMIQRRQQPRRRNRVQILLLGCGVDVIGVWAAKTSNTVDVTIIEVDMPEICHVKRELYEETGVVETLSEHATGSDDNRLRWYSGEIRRAAKDDDDSKQEYRMIPCDLKDTASLDTLFRDASTGLYPIRPTLIVSELVLAYLPPPSTDHLLSWCAASFQQGTFVALEPLGFDPQHQNGIVVGVEEGFRREYCQKFRLKMEKGQTKTKKEATPLFCPLGTSVKSVTQRLHQAGFQHASTTTLGVATTIAAASSPETMTCPEMFDEHAALALHLRSYVIAVGFSNENADDEMLRRMLCPWEVDNAMDMGRTGLPRYNATRNIIYTEIQVEDELSVRAMFASTYQGYIEQYPAIRKMVRGVLNKELQETATPMVGNLLKQPFLRRSVIAEQYQEAGGMFLVAVKYDGNEERSCCRKIVGFVGVQNCRSKTVEPNSMEVFRLVVDKLFRGQGIATQLLKAVEGYAMSRGCPKLIAKTPTILEAASRLYVACGYQMENEEPLGPDLVLTTFVKTLDDDIEAKSLLVGEDCLSSEVDYTIDLGYEEAAPTVAKRRQRRSSLLGHIQAWAGAVNQEHLDSTRDGSVLDQRRAAPRETPQNRRGSMDAALTFSPKKRMYHSSDELQDGHIDEVEDAYSVDDVRGGSHRRFSLDPMVEQAVAYVNLQPSSMNNDLDPFGSRRDSLF